MHAPPAGPTCMPLRAAAMLPPPETFAARVVLAAHVLLENQQALVADLAAGTAGAAWDPQRTPQPLVPPGEEAASKLAGRLKPNPDLAAELEKVGAPSLSLPLTLSLTLCARCVASLSPEQMAFAVQLSGAHARRQGMV
jgi:hypothetical protein